MSRKKTTYFIPHFPDARHTFTTGFVLLEFNLKRLHVAAQHVFHFKLTDLPCCFILLYEAFNKGIYKYKVFTKKLFWKEFVSSSRTTCRRGLNSLFVCFNATKLRLETDITNYFRNIPKNIMF